MEFIATNGHTVVGVDADLAKAIGGVLGLKFKVENANFDSIIPGLQSGKYDLGMSAFTDTKAREKVVDFVTYFSAGTSFYVKASGGPTVKSLADLCGQDGRRRERHDASRPTRRRRARSARAPASRA